MRSQPASYHGYRFPPDIISHAVWLYYRFCLSFRDTEDLLAQRGVTVTYETIRQWCQRFGPVYARQLRRRRGRMGDTWHLDEVFVTIQGRQQYLWRAVDEDGDVLDILVQSHRNRRAAVRFFRTLLKTQGRLPRRLITDQLRSYAAACRTVMPSVVHVTDQYANNRAEPPLDGDYTQHLLAEGLRGARIGIPRAFYYKPMIVPGETDQRGGLNDAQAAVMADAIQVLRMQGAEIVDPADIPSVVSPDRGSNSLAWGICAGMPNRMAADGNCSVVFNYGMKRDFDAYIATLGPDAPVGSLTELREFNVANEHRNAMRYGQVRLDISDEMDLEADRARL